MASNDITGDALRTRGPSEVYDKGYKRLFGERKIDQRTCEGCEQHWPINPTTLLHDNGMGQTTICMNGRTK